MGRPSEEDFDYEAELDEGGDETGFNESEAPSLRILPKLEDEADKGELRSRRLQTREGMKALLITDLMQFYGVNRSEAEEAIRKL